MDLSANLTGASISSSNTQTIVTATSARIAADNLSQSTDVGLITSSVIAGAFTGIGSIEEANRLTAVDATVKTVMQLLGKFSSSLTEATTSRSLSKTLAEAFKQIPADVSNAAASTNISDHSQVLSTAAKSQSQNIKLAPVSDENAATVLGDMTADYSQEIATNPNISSAQRQASLVTIAAKVMEGADAAGLPASTLQVATEKTSTAVVTVMTNPAVKAKLAEEGNSAKNVIEQSSSNVQAQIAKSTVLSAEQKNHNDCCGGR
jgi:hypothetical protein